MKMFSKQKIQFIQLTKQVQDNKRIEMDEDSTLSTLFKAKKENEPCPHNLCNSRDGRKELEHFRPEELKDLSCSQSFNVFIANVHLCSISSRLPV